MTFHGSNRKYKITLYITIPLAIILFSIGVINQMNIDEGFSVLSLFCLSLGIVALAVAINHLSYIFQGEKKVILAEDELILKEGKRVKQSKYTKMEDLRLKNNQIHVSLNKGRILINGIHDYPLEEIYKHLREKWKSA